MVDPQVRSELLAAYEQMMWLARQPFVTPSMARAWYTHIVAGKLARRIRMFTGKVSAKAARDPDAALRLEHHLRMQTLITQLVARHLDLKKPRPNESIELVMRCESVHVVTFDENYAARKADGDYRKAGIGLKAWGTLPRKTRQVLWAKLLHGKVANAALFEPK